MPDVDVLMQIRYTSKPETTALQTQLPLHHFDSKPRLGEQHMAGLLGGAL